MQIRIAFVLGVMAFSKSSTEGSAKPSSMREVTVFTVRPAVTAKPRLIQRVKLGGSYEPYVEPKKKWSKPKKEKQIKEKEIEEEEK